MRKIPFIEALLIFFKICKLRINTIDPVKIKVEITPVYLRNKIKTNVHRFLLAMVVYIRIASNRPLFIIEFAYGNKRRETIVTFSSFTANFHDRIELIWRTALSDKLQHRFSRSSDAGNVYHVIERTREYPFLVTFQFVQIGAFVIAFGFANACLTFAGCTYGTMLQFWVENIVAQIDTVQR